MPCLLHCINKSWFASYVVENGFGPDSLASQFGKQLAQDARIRVCCGEISSYVTPRQRIFLVNNDIRKLSRNR
jgi:hypothetical protein